MSTRKRRADGGVAYLDVQGTLRERTVDALRDRTLRGNLDTAATSWGESRDAMREQYGLDEMRERAREITDAIVEHLWDEQAGIFRLAGPDGLPVPVSAWQGLAPAALPDLPEDIRARIVDDWLMRTDRFWPAHPVPSVSLDDPTFMPGDGRIIPQYWRGPSWPFTPPFMVPALLLAGRRAEAAVLVSRIEERLDAQGFREYTDPLDGTGMGARAFTCQAVILALHAWLDRAPIPVRAAEG